MHGFRLIGDVAISSTPEHYGGFGWLAMYIWVQIEVLGVILPLMMCCFTAYSLRTAEMVLNCPMASTVDSRLGVEIIILNHSYQYAYGCVLG